MNSENIKLVGQITFEEGTIDIADPTSKRDSLFRLNDIVLRPGVYNCYIAHDESPLYGTVIRAIGIALNRDCLIDENLRLLDEIATSHFRAGFFVSPHELSRNELIWLLDSTYGKDYVVNNPAPKGTGFEKAL